MKCKLCEDEFDEQTNPNKCPYCVEKYLTISLTDYQKLVERIQDKQYEIGQLYKQVTDAYLSSNKFKNHLSREQEIYGDINAWFNSILEEFNIPKTEEKWKKVYYHTPSPCQLNPHKICNGCGDC